MLASHPPKMNYRLLAFYPMLFTFEVAFASATRLYIRGCPPANTNEVRSKFYIYDMPTEQFCKCRLAACGCLANLSRIRKNFKNKASVQCQLIAACHCKSRPELAESILDIEITVVNHFNHDLQVVYDRRL